MAAVHLLRQVYRRYEKPLVLQLCRLVRGFTHPASYFTGEEERNAGSTDRNRAGSGKGREHRQDLALFSVDEFSSEMVNECFEMVSVTQGSAESTYLILHSFHSFLTITSAVTLPFTSAHTPSLYTLLKYPLISSSVHPSIPCLVRLLINILMQSMK